MPTQNSGLPTPYPPLIAGGSDSAGYPVVDANAASVVNVSMLNPTGASSAAFPASSGGYVHENTLAVMSAILAELRVISTLLNMNSQNADLSSLRADETPGATVGAPN